MQRMETINVVYIAGLIHSGTTFFERLLASHPDMVGLGEVTQTLRASMDGTIPHRSCTCGENHKSCIIWGAIFDNADQDEGHLERLERLLRRFREVYPGRILLDSSKSPDRALYYRELKKAGFPIELKIVYLFRDVRGWAQAIRRKGPSEKKVSGARSRVGIVRNSYYWAAKVYHSLRFLQSERLTHLPVSYESVVFTPLSEMKRILDFIGVPAENYAVFDHEPESHQLFGNAMRHDPHRQQTIVYDPAWIRDRRVTWSLPITLPTVLYSSKLQRQWSAKITTHTAVKQP